MSMATFRKEKLTNGASLSPRGIIDFLSPSSYCSFIFHSLLSHSLSQQSRSSKALFLLRTGPARLLDTQPLSSRCSGPTLSFSVPGTLRVSGSSAVSFTKLAHSRFL